MFDDCVVPAENLVGEEGQSVRHMMRNLEIERVTLAAMSLGIALRCLRRDGPLRRTSAVASGEPIRDSARSSATSRESYAEWQAARSYVYDVARRLDLTRRQPRRLRRREARSSTMAKEVADRAIQVLGGYGYVGEYVVERLWRDAKLLEIGGGTLEAHQKNITRDLSRDADVLLR